MGKEELKRGESTEIAEHIKREIEIKEKRIRGRDAITREGTRVSNEELEKKTNYRH